MTVMAWSRRALLTTIGAAVVSLTLIAGGLFVVRGIAGKALAGLGVGGLGLIGAGLLALRRMDPSEWTITWDVPQALQFSGFVGEQAGFRFEPTVETRRGVEREWYSWWSELPGQIFGVQAEMDQVFRSERALSANAIWSTLGSAEVDGDDAPEFDSLRHQPALRALCREQWPRFEQQWAATKPALFSQMAHQGAAVRENRIVRASAQAAGKAQSAPFLLRLDFVAWPADYLEYRTDGHVVLGARYLAPAATAQLREIIATAVARLV